MTHILLRRPAAVVTAVLLSFVFSGFLAGPLCAAEEDEKKIVEKVKPDIWDVREEGLFFGIKSSTGRVGCTPMTALVLIDITGSTFADDVFSPDPTCLKVGGTDPTTDKGSPSDSSPRKSDPGGGKNLSTFTVTGSFP
jgi:hypothetical protein